MPPYLYNFLSTNITKFVTILLLIIPISVMIIKSYLHISNKSSIFLKFFLHIVSFFVRICVLQICEVFSGRSLIGIKEVLTVAKCSICEKSVHFGNNVSHSHRRSNRIWKSNIKSVKAIVDGSPKKIYVCTNCLKSGKVVRA